MSYAPYPAYKDTRGVWLDQIPSHWDARPLKYDIGLQNGAAFKPTDWSQNGTPIIRIENLNGGGEFNCFEGEIHPRYVIQKGDVLFGWSGNRGTSFGPFRWEKEGRYYLNQHIFKIEHQNLDQGWLYWALRAVTSYIESEAHGIIGMVHITKQKLGNIFLPVVPPEEQSAIARFLDEKTTEIDELIAKKEELLRLLAEQRTALITHAVTKGLNLNAPMKPSGIEAFGEIPAHWELVSLRWVVRTSSGDFLSNSDLEAVSDDEHAFSVVGGNGHMGFTHQANYAKNSIVVGRVGAHCGNVHYLSSPTWVTDNALKIRKTRGDVDTEFLAFLLRSLKLNDMANKNAQPLITGEMVKSRKVVLPPEKEQSEILQHVGALEGDLDRITSKVEKSIELLKEHRTALITNAVTGKIKVS